MEFKRPEEGATCVGAAVDEEDVVFIEPEEGVVDALLFFGSDGAAALKHCSKMFISMYAAVKNPGVFNEEDCCWDAVAALIFDASQELYFVFFSHDKVSLLTLSDGNIGTDSGLRSGLGALFELSIRIPDRRKLSLSVRIRLQ